MASLSWFYVLLWDRQWKPKNWRTNQFGEQRRLFAWGSPLVVSSSRFLPIYAPMPAGCPLSIQCPQGFTSSIGQDKYKCWQTSDTNTKTDKYNMRKSNCGDNINTTNESFLNVIILLCIFTFITCLSFHLHYPISLSYQVRLDQDRINVWTRLPHRVLNCSSGVAKREVAPCAPFKLVMQRLDGVVFTTYCDNNRKLDALQLTLCASWWHLRVPFI